MKKLCILYILVLAIIKIGYTQSPNNIETIPLPDSSELVFHNVPFVNIEIHGIQVRKTFDYESTTKSINSIQEVLETFKFINKEDVEYLDILDNKGFIELLANKQRNTLKINNFLSDIAVQYDEKYVCFVCQYGFTSTPNLSIAKSQGNTTAINKYHFGDANFYELNIYNLSQIAFIVFNNQSKNIVYEDILSTIANNSSKIFSKKKNQKLFLKLKRRLKRNIIRNLKKKDSAF